MLRGKDLSELRAPDINEHVSVRLICDRLLHQLCAVGIPHEAEVAVVASDAFAEGAVPAHLSDLGIVELEPAIVELRSYVCIIVARVHAATMHQDRKQMVLVYLRLAALAERARLLVVSED